MATDVSRRSCPRCQSPLAQGAASCPNCGLALPDEPGSVSSALPALACPEDASAAEPAAESPASQPPADAAATTPAALASPPPTGDASPSAETTASPTRVSRRLKRALISAAILLMLVATGGGTLYALTRPQPLITLASAYQLGTVLAGSATTALQVAGRQFSANSAITLLLDGNPAPGSQLVPSDEHGAFAADVTVTASWKIGTHQLTARDANGSATKSGTTVAVVHQGQVHTPAHTARPPTMPRASPSTSRCCPSWLSARRPFR